MNPNESTLLSLDVNDPELVYFSWLSLNNRCLQQIHCHTSPVTLPQTNEVQQTPNTVTIQRTATECNTQSRATGTSVQVSTRHKGITKQDKVQHQFTNMQNITVSSKIPKKWVWVWSSEPQTTRLVATKNYYQKKKQPYDSMVTKLRLE